jgi:hypothetical protein
MLDAHTELVELARLCWRQAQLAQTEGAARELRKMALEYQQKAAKLDSGELSILRMNDKPIGYSA